MSTLPGGFSRWNSTRAASEASTSDTVVGRPDTSGPPFADVDIWLRESRVGKVQPHRVTLRLTARRAWDVAAVAEADGARRHAKGSGETVGQLLHVDGRGSALRDEHRVVVAVGHHDDVLDRPRRADVLLDVTFHRAEGRARPVGLDVLQAHRA